MMYKNQSIKKRMESLTRIQFLYLRLTAAETRMKIGRKPGRWKSFSAAAVSGNVRLVL